MRGHALAGVLLLSACGEQAPAPVADTPGARLEAAALARGLVSDPARASPVGSWARDTDRVCVTGTGRDQRIGVVIDYGEGQGCSAGGTVRRAGDRLTVALGADCRFEAAFEGDRIVFPAAVPGGCAALCSGRASLAALDVERLSGSVSEAATLRGLDGAALCGGQD